jgi:hypothetical protein
MAEYESRYIYMSYKDLHDELKIKQNEVRELNLKKMHIESDIIGIKEELSKRNEQDRIIKRKSGLLP